MVLLVAVALAYSGKAAATASWQSLAECQPLDVVFIAIFAAFKFPDGHGEPHAHSDAQAQAAPKPSCARSLRYSTPLVALGYLPSSSDQRQGRLSHPAGGDGLPGLGEGLQRDGIAGPKDKGPRWRGLPRRGLAAEHLGGRFRRGLEAAASSAARRSRQAGASGTRLDRHALLGDASGGALPSICSRRTGGRPDTTSRMPDASFFVGGDAIHGFAPVPAYPASHCCVRMSLPEAPFVDGFLKLGTPVFAFGVHRRGFLSAELAAGEAQSCLLTSLA